MREIYLRSRAKVASLSDASHACLIAGRFLLTLIAILLPAMIWTERFSTFDRFFQGGQDCEMSILALFAFLCLVILLSQRGSQSTQLALLVYRFLSGMAGLFRPDTASFAIAASRFKSGCSILSTSALASLPLRI